MKELYCCCQVSFSTIVFIADEIMRQDVDDPIGHRAFFEVCNPKAVDQSNKEPVDEDGCQKII